MTNTTTNFDAYRAASEGSRITPSVRIWLIGVAALIAIMVLVGGATRLTDSGLSITEWKPILGAIPPLNQADWIAVFEKYKTIPEYTEVNAGMTLAEFKAIFWWEWGHRFLGRIIGLAFFVPFVWFLIRGQIPSRLRLPLVGLFILGGLQGALGWYMVKSGLAIRVDVSQYRLAAHLGLAILIYIFLVWLILRESRDSRTDDGPRSPTWLRWSSAGLIAAVFLQIISGAFVAGMHAGRSHNTWPLIDGAFWPDGLFIMSPAMTNLFENPLTVQFNHRMLAYVIVIWAIMHVIAAIRSAMASRTAQALGVVVVGQVALGIWTLLAIVPIHLGIAHQAGALVVLTTALIHANAVRSRST